MAAVIARHYERVVREMPGLTEAQLAFVSDACEQHRTTSLWIFFGKPRGIAAAPHEFESFDQRKAAFLHVVHLLVAGRRVEVVRHIDGMPVDEAELADALPEEESALDDGLWFLTHCPVGVRWRPREEWVGTLRW